MLSKITRPIAVSILTFAVISAGWSAFSTWRWIDAERELGGAKENADNAADVADSNAEQLTMCIGRINAQIKAREQAEQAEREANRRLEEQTRRARDLAERERAARQEAYDGDCEDWSEHVACPAAIDSLRRARGDENRDG